MAWAGSQRRDEGRESRQRDSLEIQTLVVNFFPEKTIVLRILQ